MLQKNPMHLFNGDRNNSIKLFTSSSVYTRARSDFTLVGIAWQYRWGGGL
jgi:hypothetical protein